MPRRSSHPPVMLAGLLLASALAQADTRASLVDVTANVIPVATLEVRSAPQAVSLTPADLRRGFIDVHQPWSLTVSSNSPQGFILDIASNSVWIAGVRVSGLEEDRTLPPSGGTLERHWSAAGTLNVDLRLRLLLVPGLKSGSYPFPLALAVRPLE